MSHPTRHFINRFEGSCFLRNTTFHHTHNLMTIYFDKFFSYSIGHLIDQYRQTMGTTSRFVDIMQQA